MATTRYNSNDFRRQLGSPRPKGRADTKDTLCRNILIYGHCRYEGAGCAFNHDQTKKSPKPDTTTRKTLNVDSAPFTPAVSSQPSKKTFSSSHAASAAVFTPRATAATPTGTPTAQETDIPPAANTPSAFSNIAAIREFTPQQQNYDLTTNGAAAATQDASLNYDPFTMNSVASALPAAQYNPYASTDHTGLVAHGGAYFPSAQAGYQSLIPPSFHLYAPIGPYREDLQPWQRSTYDFFMPENLRLELQNKSHAALQTMTGTAALQMPQVGNYHTLVTLDKTSNRKSSSLFGYVTWVYKAVSGKTSRLYSLRRLEGFTVSNDQILRPVKEWKKITNGNIVAMQDAFTTRAWGDSSLMFSFEYFPLAETLMEHHFPNAQHKTSFRSNTNHQASETVLWSYIVQISNALNSIHSNGLAARCIDATKIIITGKNHIRLSSCGILDVINYEKSKPMAELQEEDFVAFGKLIVSLATNTPPTGLNLGKAIEQMGRNHSSTLKDMVLWLLNPPQAPGQKTVKNLVAGINEHVMTAFDAQQRQSDMLYSELYREVENGRVLRLLMKLATINERTEYDKDAGWSENGDRYMLKLFRDYVFHQVDAQGRPVLDPGHMLRCLSKLDVGTEERIKLTSRDCETDFLVTYKDLKGAVQSAFGELLKGSGNGRGGPVASGSGHGVHHPSHRDRF
ncbi:PAB-dependent poly(A)-specific ribonuclease subunit 3 [Pyricularia grisea]|nr:PAB-dependent poly(A)-specific ribonuclease subunit 3 [Pyricularia grisea]